MKMRIVNYADENLMEAMTLMVQYNNDDGGSEANE